MNIEFGVLHVNHNKIHSLDLFIREHRLHTSRNELYIVIVSEQNAKFNVRHYAKNAQWSYMGFFSSIKEIVIGVNIFHFLALYIQ